MAEKFPIVTNARQLGYRRRDSSVGTDVVPVERILETDVKVVEMKGVVAGSTNAVANTAAMNAFLLKYKGTLFSLDPKVEIRFPPGRYYLSEALIAWPGAWLVGNQTTLVTANGFSDDCFIRMTGGNSGGYTYCYRAGVVGISFESSTVGVAAVRTDSDVLANSRFQDLVFYCYDGLLLQPSYCQELDIKGIFSYGPINTILKMGGNWNRIENIEKEGVSGSNAEPYIQIGLALSEPNQQYGSYGNVLKRILLEGAASDNKTEDILFFNAHEFRLENQWHEWTPGENSPALFRCVDTYGGIVTGVMAYDQTRQKIFLENSTVRYDYWHGPAFAGRLSGVLDVDATSTFTMDPLYTTIDLDTYPWATSERIRTKSVINTHIKANPVAGIIDNSQPIMTGPNMLVNVDFMKELDGWYYNFAASPTITYAASPVSLGKIATFTWASQQAIAQLYQQIPISAAQAGKPFSLGCWIWVETGANGVNPFFFNCGVGEDNLYGICSQTGGWQLLQKTVVPQSAGTLFVGINMVGITKVHVTGMAFRAGVTALPDLDPPYNQAFTIGRMVGGTITNWQPGGPHIAVRTLAAESDRAAMHMQHESAAGTFGYSIFAYSNGDAYHDVHGDRNLHLRCNTVDAVVINDNLVSFNVPTAFTLPMSVGGMKVTIGAAAPTTGTGTKGDIHHNVNSDSGEPSFWKCTADGTPGTWVGCAIIP